MTPYAHYAAKPLPCSVPLYAVLYGCVAAKPKSARKVTFAADESEDFTGEEYTARPKQKRPPVNKPDTLARYMAVLSKKEWTSSRDISRAMHVNVNSVNRYLSTYSEMFEKRQEMRRTGLTNMWRIRVSDNVEVRGASRPAGEASSAEGATSTVVLEGGKDDA